MPRNGEAKRMSVMEYLEFEAKAQTRHEFVDGFVFAMAGASEIHNLIAGNIFALVRAAARTKPCRAYVSDMKVQIEDVFYYPDVFLSCDERDLGENIKRHPCFIIEVLSESTADIDRGEKLINYRRLESLRAYVLISQQQKLIEVYRRLEDNSWRHDILEGGSFILPCLDLRNRLKSQESMKIARVRWAQPRLEVIPNDILCSFYGSDTRVHILPKHEKNGFQTRSKGELRRSL
jgi:Uma2 family endonuclease